VLTRTQDIEPRVYPNLEEFCIYWDPPRYQELNTHPYEGFYPPLRRLDLRGLCLELDAFVKLPTSLEYLRIQGGPSRPMVVDVPKGRLPNLNTIIFHDVGFVTMEILETFILASHAPIQTLHLDRCFHISAYAFESIFAYLDMNPDLKLSELSVSHMQHVDDTFVRVLFKRLPLLQVLNLSHTDITGVTIRMCADARGSPDGVKLDRLFVRGCERVSSDAVAYGRERGLEVVT